MICDYVTFHDSRTSLRSPNQGGWESRVLDMEKLAMDHGGVTFHDSRTSLRSPNHGRRESRILDIENLTMVHHVSRFMTQEPHCSPGITVDGRVASWIWRTLLRFISESRYRGITQVRVETRRDRGGLEPKSKRGRRKREVRLRRTEDYTGTRPLQHREHEETPTQVDTNKRIYI